MKNYFILLFSLLCICCFSQTKEELMNSIIKRNVFESDCIGAGCTMSEQYENFQKLIKISSEKELLKLTDHKNSVLRVYAQTYFIEQNKNVIEIFKKELKRNKKIETYEGCLIDFEYIYSIIYHNYWNSVRLNSITEFDTICKSSGKVFSYNLIKFIFLSIIIFKLSIINKTTFEIAEKEIYKIELITNTSTMEKTNCNLKNYSEYQEISENTNTVRLSK